MKYLIWFLLVLAGNGYSMISATKKDVETYGFAVVRGGSFWCVLGPQETQCFSEIVNESDGRYKILEKSVVSFPTPALVAAGHNVLCRGERDTVTCATLARSPEPGEDGVQAKSFELSLPNVKAFEIAGFGYTNWANLGIINPNCIISEGRSLCTYFVPRAASCGGPTCSRDHFSEQRRELSLDNERVATGNNFVCYVVEEEVECIGLRVPFRIQAPKKLVSGSEHVCALTDESVVCWGRIDGTPKTFNHPMDLMVGERYTCAEDDNGITCWGENPPRFEKRAPLGLAVKGVGAACTIWETSINCDAYKDNFTYEVWTKFKAFLDSQFSRLPRIPFQIADLEKALSTLSEITYPHQKIFFSNLKMTVENAPVKEPLSGSIENASARLLLMHLMAPLVKEVGKESEDKDSEIYLNLIRGMKEGNAELGVSDSSRIRPYSIVSIMALQSAKQAIAGVENLITRQNERESIVAFGIELTRLLGEFEQHEGELSIPKALMAKARDVMSQRSDTIRQLIQSRVTRGFGEVLLGVSKYFGTY